MIYGECKSGGGWPEGIIVWYIEDKLQLNVTENTAQVMDSAGDFYMISHMNFTVSQDSKVCCTAHNTVLNDNKTTCQFITAKVLEATPYSTPWLNFTRDGAMVHGTCKTWGGYPKGRITWHFKNGSEVYPSKTYATMLDSKKRFVMISYVNFTVSQDSKVCCTVHSTVVKGRRTTCHFIRVTHESRENWHIAAGLGTMLFLVVLTIIPLVQKCRPHARVGVGEEVAGGRRRQTNQNEQDPVIQVELAPYREGEDRLAFARALEDG
nr:PREDICTED: uncharacterized protein LOC106703917 [Latimeria chalumnae]|eukprot:XP_014345239.1 PREDICTED: uncharacterized protein LOC106703917 [Latimeria chalumnae]